MSGEISRALTVEAALQRMRSSQQPIAETETVGLMDAVGRVLAAPLSARLTQPPFDASAMDGYAVRAVDVARLPARLTVIGEAAAGHEFGGRLSAGEAVRIFTGAPVPKGADAIVIQENTRRDGNTVEVTGGDIDADHVRPRGGDFSAGTPLLPTDRRLNARDVTLAAAMGHATLAVRRRPTVAIIATGDELVSPGEDARGDQIVCSNPYGVAAIVRAAGGVPAYLGIARDDRADLQRHFERAAADIVVTLGGASVGDHDLVAPVITERGGQLDFWKIAMRPGKPLMFGTWGSRKLLGLPGNPVSSLLTARLFLMPLIEAMLGVAPDLPPRQAVLAVPLGANGPRAHYMRATTRLSDSGQVMVTPCRSQDSSLLTPLVEADCLIVRPIGASAAAAGTSVPILMLDF